MNRDVRRSFRVGDSFDSIREAQPDRARRLIMAAKKPASKKPAAKKAASSSNATLKKPASKPKPVAPAPQAVATRPTSRGAIYTGTRD